MDTKLYRVLFTLVDPQGVCVTTSTLVSASTEEQAKELVTNMQFGTY